VTLLHVTLLASKFRVHWAPREALLTLIETVISNDVPTFTVADDDDSVKLAVLASTGKADIIKIVTNTTNIIAAFFVFIAI
jgi:hypothetical protein